MASLDATPDFALSPTFDYPRIKQSLNLLKQFATPLQVGCGGGRGKADATKSGSFLVLKSENLALRHEAKVGDIDNMPHDIWRHRNYFGRRQSARAMVALVSPPSHSKAVAAGKRAKVC